MKRAWYIFKEYYLHYMVMYIVLMAIIYFLEGKARDEERFKFLLAFIAVSSLLIAMVQHFKEVYYKPWKKNRILTKSPFKEFLDKGFSKQDNYLRGQIDGYNLVVGVEWSYFQSRPEYFFKIIFNPLINGRFLNQNECSTYNSDFGREKSRFTLNSIVKFYGQRKLFLRTEYEDIKKDIRESIAFLKFKKIEPISFSEWELYIPKLKHHTEAFVYD